MHINFKAAIVAADDAGTVLLDVPGNPTMRVLRTGLAARISDHDPGAQLLGRIADLYFAGDLEASVANTGQVPARSTEPLPMAEIVRSPWSGHEAVLDGARTRPGCAPARHGTR